MPGSGSSSRNFRAPALRHHGVESLENGLGANVGRDLVAAELLAAVRDLLIARQPIAPGANGRRDIAAARDRGAGEQVKIAVGVLHLESPVVV